MSAYTTTQRWVLGLASLAAFMAGLDLLAVSTALTTIRADLGASLEELEWTVNGFNLSLAMLLLPAAVLGDRYGRRRLFAAGLALFTVASAACVLAPDVGWLIGARVVQGAGAAFVVSLGLSLVSAGFPAAGRGAAIGILEGLTGVALVAGPVVGGAITAGISWEWIFWLNVPIGLVAVPLALTRIRESRAEHGARLDLAGVALVTGAALGVVWGLVRGNVAGWESLEVLGALGGGLVLLAAFVGWELRARAPMLPMGHFRRRAFSVGNAATVMQFASTLGVVFFLAQFLQAAMGYSPLQAGLAIAPWTATLFFVAPLAGALTDRIGGRPLAVGGLLVQAAGMAWVALIAEPGLAYGALVVPLVLGGIGASAAIPAMQTTVIGAVAPDAVGQAAGTNALMRELGGVLGIAGLVAVFGAAGSYASPAAFSDGFVAALAAASALALAGALTSVALPGRRLCA